MAGARDDPRFKSMLGSEFNLAWKAIQENAFLRADPKLAEFFMSVSGTLISRKNEAGLYVTETRVSLAGKEGLLSALLHGGEVQIYRCRDKDGGCLRVEEQPLTIQPSDSLIERVRLILGSIQSKIYGDEALSQAEIDFLGSTRLPFYKIINVSTAYRRGGSPVDILEYAELGAVDILFQYLSEILDVIHESVDHIRLTQVDSSHLDQFQRSLEAARRRIIERRTGTFQQVEQVISLVRKTELLEKSLFLKAGALSAEGL